jgi:Ca2+:H+ antiporter
MHHWSWLIPVLAVGLLIVALAVGVGTLLAVLCGAALIGAVLVAVHHAEVVAHRVGEPYGTLVLALAVTAIETALILSMMMAGGEEMAVLPRDAIYAAVMIICTGVVGLCVLLGGLKHHEQTFRVEGAGAGLAALFVMATLTLVLPAFTTSTPGGRRMHVRVGRIDRGYEIVPVAYRLNEDKDRPQRGKLWVALTIACLSVVTVRH